MGLDMAIRATALALISLLLLPSTSEAAGDRLVFTRNSATDKPQGVFTMRPDGTGLRRVSDRPAGLVQWSPDRTKIAYTRQTCPTKQDCDAFIWLMKADGSDRHRFAGNADRINSFDWSPDSRSIVYAASDFENDDIDILIATAGRRRVRRLIDTPGVYEYGGDWSPDGNTIAFTREGGGVYTVPAAGGEEELLEPDGSGPLWSPDGSKIAFTTTRDDPPDEDDDRGYNQLYVMDSDGSDQVRISTAAGRYKLGPQWSRDSRFLTWHEDCGVDACVDDLWVGAADGSSTRNVTSTEDLFEENPQWSRDGGRLIFTRWRTSSGRTDIFSIRTDGSGLKRLTDTPGPEGAPDWQTW